MSRHSSIKTTLSSDIKSHASPSNIKSQISNIQSPRVAIVADWLIGGGAERVVYELHRLYPDAQIYTSYCNKKSRAQFKDADIRVSYMQRFPLSKLYKFLPILREHWFENVNLKEFDLIISASGAEAKGIKNIKPSALHINYCHSPTHYYWVRYYEYLQNPGFGIFDPIARIGIKLLLESRQRWDYRAAQRPKYIIANSNCVKDRIEQIYNRDSEVIFPPVDTKRFHSNIKYQISNIKRSGFVIAGRQTPYKRIDLAVAACTKAGLPLTVIGDGPEHKKLKKMAGPTISFKTNVSDGEISKYFQEASAFIFPNEDDFGITPVEAMAAGTPVIALKAGGALDYVIPGKTGEFFTKQNADSLADVLTNFDASKYDSEKIIAHAKNFSVEAFHKNIGQFVNSKLK